jgi:hypothetical protein
MHNTIPLSLAALVSVAIVVIGCFYVTSPQRILGGFGLKPPTPDPDTRAWLRLKGIRDVASGFALLTLMLTTDNRTVGIVLLVSPLSLLATCPIFWCLGGERSQRYPFME